jgi:hypothetical protein
MLHHSNHDVRNGSMRPILSHLAVKNCKHTDKKIRETDTGSPTLHRKPDTTARSGMDNLHNKDHRKKTETPTQIATRRSETPTAHPRTGRGVHHQNKMGIRLRRDMQHLHRRLHGSTSQRRERAEGHPHTPQKTRLHPTEK